MIVECENCRTTFNLEEDLLSNTGSKVRCSICRHVFRAYPPQPSASEDVFEETIALDSPVMEKDRYNDQKLSEELAFDEILDESLEEDITALPPSAEDLEEIGDQEEGGELAIEEFVEDEVTKEEPLLESPEMAGMPSLKKKSGKSLAILIVLVILLLLLGGAAAVVHWAPQYLPDFLKPLNPPKKISTADPGIRRLSFTAVTGSFLKAKKAGRLFVIKGAVTNKYPKNRRFILIKGTVLDDKGVVVRKKVAYAGNALNEEKLNQLSLEEINSAMKSRQNSEVAPDESIPFTIVFEGLPQNLSEFTVEAVSSSPVE